MASMRIEVALVPLALAACVGEQRVPAASYPDSLYTFQRVAGNALVVRRGFRVDEWASGLPDVRVMALGPDGEVYATLKRSGRVVRIASDGVTDVVTGLNSPHGLAFRGDTLWVAETQEVLRLAPPYTRADTVIAGLPDDGGHSTRTIRFRDDHVFVAIGSSCNLCDEQDPRRASIMRYDLDGSNGERFATGLRNSVGLALNPWTGTLWATNNDRDRLGDDRPPDRVNHIVEDGWYGWPVCYLPGQPNPEYRDQGSRCSEALGPAVRLPAHSAPLGLVFYNGTMFPDPYRGSLFVALHGSWDRSFPIGYKVVRVPFADGKPAGEPEDFIVGWQVGRQSWGRPVEFLVMPDGSLLISDDQGGRIYRVSWNGV